MVNETSKRIGRDGTRGLRRVSPFLSWLFSVVLMGLVEWLVYIVPALGVGLLVTYVVSGREMVMTSVDGLLLVWSEVFSLIAGNLDEAFGVFVLVYVVFLFLVEDTREFWERSSVNKGEVSPRIVGVAVAGSFVFGVVSLLVWLGAVDAMLFVVGGVYALLSWVMANWVASLAFYDEYYRGLRPLKIMWMSLTRVPVMYVVYMGVFSPVSVFPVEVSVSIALLSPIAGGGYLLWRRFAQSSSVDPVSQGEYQFE